MENATSNKIKSHTIDSKIYTSHRKSKIAILLVGMVLFSGIVIVSLLRDRIVNQQWWSVSVTGRGAVQYQPDIALVTLGVQIDKAEKAEEALSQLTEKMDAIMKALEIRRIPAEDIKTQNYSLYPQYEMINQRSTLVGYEANQQITIKIKNVDNSTQMTGAIIEAATKAGANQVVGVSFEVSNLEELKQEARIKAIQDAEQKANALALVAGVKLERVVGWWENFIQLPNSTMPLYYGYGGEGGIGGGGGGNTLVSSGVQEVIVETGVNYLIK